MKPKVFICSPYRNDIEGNTQKARQYCRYAVKKGYIPFAPHLIFPQFLNEQDSAERELGIEMGLQILLECDEIWVFSDSFNNFSEGMRKEIAFANKHRKRIKFLDF